MGHNIQGWGTTYKEKQTSKKAQTTAARCSVLEMISSACQFTQQYNPLGNDW